jgi:Uma2 family endonuclease
MLKSKLKIGPHDHGRQMSLKLFEPAKVENGHLYELSRGFIVVSGVPNYPHAMRLAAVRNQVVVYQAGHPQQIHVILGTMDCKLLIWDFESERHSDLAIYLAPPFRKRGRKVWKGWIPDIVIEVVSEWSSDRDYTLKREEYWTLGVKEYWIVDVDLGQILILRRGRTKWTEKTLGREDVYETKLLPGFRLECLPVFDAAPAAED